MGRPQNRVREWESELPARMKNVGLSLKGIITGVEEKAMGCMTLSDFYWNDSKILMHNWRGMIKRWGDSVSSAILLIPEETKR